MRYWIILLIICSFAYSEVNDTDISVAFENANLTNIADGGTNVINGDYDYHGVESAGLGFCFKVTGNYAGQTVTFNIGNIDYSGAWKPVYSYDGGETWYRNTDGNSTGGTWTFSIAFEDKGSEVIVCCDYYTNLSLINAWITGLSNDDLKTNIFGTSVDGASLYALTITSTGIDNSRKKTVLLTAGQHPYEAVGFYTCKAIVDYLLIDTPYTNELRNRYKWVVLPCLNPDGFGDGAGSGGGLGRYNANGADLNREWETGDRSEPEVAATWAYINTIYPSPSVHYDFHGLGGGFAYYKTPHRLILNNTEHRIQSLYRIVKIESPNWSAITDDSTPFESKINGAIAINLGWTSNVVETSMLTYPQTKVQLADNAKSLVKAIIQYLK